MFNKDKVSAKEMNVKLIDKVSELSEKNGKLVAENEQKNSQIQQLTSQLEEVQNKLNQKQNQLDTLTKMLMEGFGINAERMLDEQAGLWTGRAIHLSSFTLKKAIQDELAKLSWQYLSEDEGVQEFMMSVPGYTSHSTAPEKPKEQLAFVIMSLRHIMETDR